MSDHKLDFQHMEVPVSKFVPAGYCSRCGRVIAVWEFNGPAANDLTTCGAEMHTSCYQAEAKEIEALGNEAASVQAEFGKHLQPDSQAVQDLLGESARRMADAISYRVDLFDRQVRQIGLNRPSSCAKSRRR
jgi:hypothetical protein